MSSIFACDLGLNRKTLSRNFFCCFSSTSTGGKCALHWFYCLEKQKLSLERTPPGKKLRFCIRYLWKMKEKPANLNRGVCFSMKWKATCRNWAHLDEEKQFSLKSHLRASCTQAFNLKLIKLRNTENYNLGYKRRNGFAIYNSSNKIWLMRINVNYPRSHFTLWNIWCLEDV